MTKHMMSSKISQSKTETYMSLGKMRNLLVSSVREYHNIQDDKWINITDPTSSSLIMNIYGDMDNRKILSCVIERPDTVMGIVSQCKIPQTTAYSKIIGLIEHEFLIPYDMIQKKNRHVNRYVSMFKELQIRVSKDQLTIRARLADFM